MSKTNNTINSIINIIIFIFLTCIQVYAEDITIPYVFSDNKIAYADQVNKNFNTLLDEIYSLSSANAKAEDTFEVMQNDINTLKSKLSLKNTQIDALNNRLRVLEEEKPRCRVRLNDNISHSLHDSIWTAIEWDVADYNSGNCWNSNNKEQLIAPSSGLYSLQGLIVSDNTSNDITEINVYYQHGSTKEYLGYWSIDRNNDVHTEWITISLQHYMEQNGFLVIEARSSDFRGNLYGALPGDVAKVSFMTFAKIQ